MNVLFIRTKYTFLTIIDVNSFYRREKILNAVTNAILRVVGCRSFLNR